MKLFDIILKPVVTEKATAAEKNGKYQFFVRKDSTKIDVKRAFEKLYGVAAAKVNVIHTAEKTRSGRTRRPILKRSSYKKIIVTTKAKKTVDIAKPKFKT